MTCKVESDFWNHLFSAHRVGSSSPSSLVALLEINTTPTVLFSWIFHWLYIPCSLSFWKIFNNSLNVIKILFYFSWILWYIIIFLWSPELVLIRKKSSLRTLFTSNTISQGFNILFLSPETEKPVWNDYISAD